MFRRPMIILALIILTSVLTGCVSYYQPRYGGDGVYYEQAYRATPARAVYVDPVIYPYWSLDYFYFSRHYTPYSVLVHRFDPWYYPYPGWYYGYRGRPGFSVSLGYGYYPWYSFSIHYRHYRPWKPDVIHYPRDAVRYVDRPASHHRVREIDQRMRALEQRQRVLAASPARPAEDGRFGVSQGQRSAGPRPAAMSTRGVRVRSMGRDRSSRPVTNRPGDVVNRSAPRVLNRADPRLDRSPAIPRSESPASSRGSIERLQPPPRNQPPVRIRSEAPPARSPEPRRSSPPARSRPVERRSPPSSRREPPARPTPSRSRPTARSEVDRRRER